jgi:hypothetical protein
MIDETGGELEVHTMTRIDVAGQLGGKDAQPYFRPHFKALKAACAECRLRGLDTSKLTYILRVDGEVATYGGAGVGPIDVDQKNNWISVDLEISIEDRAKMDSILPVYLRDSISVLTKQFSQMDVRLFSSDIETFIGRYLEALASQPITPNISQK